MGRQYQSEVLALQEWPRMSAGCGRESFDRLGVLRDGPEKLALENVLAGDCSQRLYPRLINTFQSSHWRHCVGNQPSEKFKACPWIDSVRNYNPPTLKFRGGISLYCVENGITTSDTIHKRLGSPQSGFLDVRWIPQARRSSRRETRLGPALCELDMVMQLLASSLGRAPTEKT